jgi:SAM-dependent methyltransferase
VVAVVATSYDLLPYSSKPYALTHPDNMATIAGMAGLRTPPLERCRVLELGCGAGGNLIPMALGLPGATFVGIDLSRRQIADARSLAGALGLANTEFRALDITEVDESLGLFDFIVCHGVFSWVSATVRQAILAVCRRNLRPNGVAYVSYNVYPGWHLKGLVRDILLYGVRRDAEPRQRVEDARAVLEAVSRRVSNRQDGYGRLLSNEVRKVAGASDAYLFHEYLEDVNQPVYFHRFAEMAAAHGLRYLADARSRVDLRAAGDPVKHEQDLDFLVMRSFRRSLLCHREARLDPAVGAVTLRSSHARARARPVSTAPDVDSDRVEEFRMPTGKLWSTRNRLDKTLLTTVAVRYPATMAFQDLAEEVGRQTEIGPGADDLAEALRRCWAFELIDLYVHPLVLPERIGKRPTASPLARIQSCNSSQVTNLRHHSVDLDSVAQAMLDLLDGTRDRTELAAALGLLARGEPLAGEGTGKRPRRSERRRDDIDGSLAQLLRFYQRSALLVS